MRKLRTSLLLRAHGMGVFPMAQSAGSAKLLWIEPKKRGIIPLEAFRLSRSLARFLRKTRCTATLDRDFPGVIKGCAGRPSTWINAEIRDLYTALHNEGCAHSIEIWDEGKKLVGGVYGVPVGGVFCAESKFGHARDVSKLALAWLGATLKRCGFEVIDVQFWTRHLCQFGAVEISQERYRAALARLRDRGCRMNASSFPEDADAVLDALGRGR